MFDKIYFGSGGFYSLYHHVGAIRELHIEYNKPDSKLSRDIIYYGNSIGASASILCYLVLENLLHIDKLGEFLNHVNRFDTINLNFTAIACSLLDLLFDQCPTDTHKRVSNLIHIGVTTKNGFQMVSQFASNADLYHTLLCSSLVPGISNYDSKINGDTCIDGVYSFNYEFLPANTMIIKTSMFSAPLTITIPPLIIQPGLIEYGKQNVIDSINNTQSVTDMKDNNQKHSSIFRSMLDTNSWLLVHDLTYKNPMWKIHIESKTNSKISNDVKSDAGFFDILNYVHYSLLNHRY